MPHYLLSVHTTGDAMPSEPPSPEQMAAHMAAIDELETAMHDTKTWVFSARLSDPGSATVVRTRNGERLLTDGPFAESKEHMAGFYIIDAADLDAALDWGERVTSCIGMPIEVRPMADFKA